MSEPPHHDAMAAPLRAILAALDPPTGDRLAAAVHAHLAGFDARQLPATARPAWQRLTTLITGKRTGEGPPTPLVLPGDLSQRLAAWPAERVEQVRDLLNAIVRDVEREAEQRWNDEIRERVARAYL